MAPAPVPAPVPVPGTLGNSSLVTAMVQGSVGMEKTDEYWLARMFAMSWLEEDNSPLGKDSGPIEGGSLDFLLEYLKKKAGSVLHFLPIFVM